MNFWTMEVGLLGSKFHIRRDAYWVNHSSVEFNGRNLCMDFCIKWVTITLHVYALYYAFYLATDSPLCKNVA